MLRIGGDFSGRDEWNRPTRNSSLDNIFCCMSQPCSKKAEVVDTENYADLSWTQDEPYHIFCTKLKQRIELRRWSAASSLIGLVLPQGASG